MSESFVHLHNHTSYSLLDGLGRIDDLVQAAHDHGMPAVALTDHGAMFGAIEFYSKARDVGVKPIIGCEAYIADRPLSEKPTPASKSHHLLLLAENEIGYRNLIKLTTEAHLRGFYRKPRVDHDLLQQHADGLVCLSGCAASEIPSMIMSGDISGAERRADWYRSVFGDRYYLELQNHNLEIDPGIIDGVMNLHRRMGIPVVATNDVHYVRAADASAHEVLLCVQTQTTMADPKRMRLETPEFYLKAPHEMEALFGHVYGALSNSLEIAERCNLELTFGRPQLPRFDTPEGQSSEQYLRELCDAGLRRRYERVTPEIDSRLRYELEVILNTGFVDYFLLVYDLIHFAREQGIAVGPGRGSSAGCLVAYLLFITNIDPIQHGLSFERFLNPERVTMPDMDLDFADDRRDEVIRYVSEKYGRDRVAQIITFGTMGPRAGVRDVGRVLGMAYGDIDRVAKLMPALCNKVSKAKEEVAELRQLYDSNPDIAGLLDTVETLEGVARHASTHAAGVIIGKDPLTEHVPLYKVPKNDQVTTQYAMASIEKIGLLKMDFLGLRTLTILERARSFVQQTTGEPLDLDAIPLDDPSIYELLSSGDTFGVFQVDGAGFRKLMRELKPTEFNHIVAANALYRPGPMEHIAEFVARKNGRKEVEYAHPALEEVLRETYGIVVYQDQVMRLAVKIAGYSMGEADLLRRAMAKKKPEELARHRSTFVQRAADLGTNSATAEHLFNVIEPFAGYAFPKAHSAAYAVVTCQTAYLKAKYPREYLAGLLSAELENAERVTEAMAECRRLGIAILPPDVNASSMDFTLADGGVRFGLCAIKHVGAGPIESILSARAEAGRFNSLEDFLGRLDWGAVNKRVIESLARCGALDGLGIERGRILGSIDRVVQFGQQLFGASTAGQTSLFGEAEHPRAVLQLGNGAPLPLEEKLAAEQELLGIYVSPHPLAEAEQQFPGLGVVSVSSLSGEHDGKRTSVGGMIRNLRSFSTKAGQPMASFQLADLQNSVEAVVFSRAYENLSGKLAEGAMVVVDGKVDASDGRLRLLADGMCSMEEAAARPVSKPAAQESKSRAPHGMTNYGAPAAPNGNPSLDSAPSFRLVLELSRSLDRHADLELLERVYGVLQRYRGSDEAELLVKQGGRATSVPLPNKTCCVCDQLKAELRRLLPAEDVRVVELRAEV